MLMNAYTFFFLTWSKLIKECICQNNAAGWWVMQSILFPNLDLKRKGLRNDKKTRTMWRTSMTGTNKDSRYSSIPPLSKGRTYLCPLHVCMSKVRGARRPQSISLFSVLMATCMFLFRWFLCQCLGWGCSVRSYGYFWNIFPTVRQAWLSSGEINTATNNQQQHMRGDNLLLMVCGLADLYRNTQGVTPGSHFRFRFFMLYPIIFIICCRRLYITARSLHLWITRYDSFSKFMYLLQIN